MCARFRDAHAAVGSVHRIRDVAAGKTPNIASAMGSTASRLAIADEAIASWVVAHDVPWNAVDSRDALWKLVCAAVAACPEYKPAERAVMSSFQRPETEGTRVGGLCLARETVTRERGTILKAAKAHGGTLVSDGAKLKGKRRGMLNSALASKDGVIFLQSTDATGKIKNGEFLSDDLSAACEAAGPFTVLTITLPTGAVETKKKSDVVFLVVTDRGGGCPRALRLLEKAWVRCMHSNL